MKFESKGIRVVAFADDVVIIVSRESRKQLEEKGQIALKIAETWCLKCKMKLSEKKTEMMLAKGKLSQSRPTKVTLAGKQVGLVSEFKYLGLTIQYGVEGLKAGKHLEIIGKKSKAMFSSLKIVAKRDWGLGCRSLRTIYKGLFLAMATYVGSVWMNLVNKKDWKKIESAQRHALIGLTCSYRTISLDAVQVLAGVLPIDL